MPERHFPPCPTKPVRRCGRRRPGKRADYILRYRADFPIAVVEAKPDYATPGEGMQQAKEYAEITDFDTLAESANQSDADPFDLLCYIAYNAPLRTRRERARRLLAERPDSWGQYTPEARAILEELLEKCAAHGVARFVMPEVLEVPPISDYGNVMEIAEKFGGEQRLLGAVSKVQSILYL